LTGYLANMTGPVSLVVDFLLAHDRWVSSSDPNLNDNLYYPNDMNMNDLITTCKQLVWSTRIGRNMSIWNCHNPGSSVLGSPRSSTYRDVCVQTSTSRLSEPTPLTVYRDVTQVPPPLCSSMVDYTNAH
jgi:hypothetical protein